MGWGWGGGQVKLLLVNVNSALWSITNIFIFFFNRLSRHLSKLIIVFLVFCSVQFTDPRGFSEAQLCLSFVKS